MHEPSIKPVREKILQSFFRNCCAVVKNELVIRIWQELDKNEDSEHIYATLLAILDSVRIL